MILDIIAIVSNPANFKRRYTLFEGFCNRMKQLENIRLTTIELQQGSRPFSTNATIKLRSKHELWHKENLINIAIQQLCSDWQYVAWIDADIEFINPNWVEQTLHELQTYDIVQLFSHAIDLGPKYETLQVHLGFVYLYNNDVPLNNYRPNKKQPQYKNGHSGYAWAITKEAYNAIGGLIDFAILGSADAHMAMAFIGDVEISLNSKLHKNYKDLVLTFQDRCEKHIKRNIGYVPGTIYHFHHGSKKCRRYSERYNILFNNNFDPLKDIKKDHQGLWQLEDNKLKLRDDIRKYFRQRNEDSVDVCQDYIYTKCDWR